MGTRLRLHAAGLNESGELSLKVVKSIGFMFGKFFVCLEMRRPRRLDSNFYSHLCRKSDPIRGIERDQKER